ncbi:MAG: DNA polymerase III subunit epsilon [Gammaproteobacteria bacterium]|nr:DNA polymerase III subunit epsilon [Gammaproteobacteria bacterium]
MRQVVLDTETTGLDWEHGHRVIEIGCIEILNRRQTENSFHCYLNPERSVDEAAREVHGLSDEDLADKPFFRDIAGAFLGYLGDAELVIHNASFDLGFLDNELEIAGMPEVSLAKSNQVMDTLILARQIHPGQRNSLDALCKRYTIDNSKRELHGALLDARLLAEVYLAMTGGQGALSLERSEPGQHAAEERGAIDRDGLDLVVLRATDAELEQHETQLDMIDAACSEGSVWRRTQS